MKFNRIISTALACVMLLGTFTAFPLGVAADETEAEVFVPTSTTITAQSAGKLDANGESIINYTSVISEETIVEDGKTVPNPEFNAFMTREEKLATMLLVTTVGNIEVYYEAYTGEVAFKNVKSGDVLFTNPYDVTSTYNADISKKQREDLLSQIKITFLNNGKEEEFNSFVEAAERKQITMKYIKNGIRVEYQIGEPAIQRLTPRMISVTRMQTYIINSIEEYMAAYHANPDDKRFDQLRNISRDPADWLDTSYDKFKSYYKLYDPNLAGQSERAVKEMIKAFPICRSFPVYVCETNISAAELKRLETFVKLCCPKYTYEELDFDNQQCGFKNTDQSPPRFSMALEYTIDAKNDTIDVTLPANGISFDETMYQLQDVTILPHMGTGLNLFEGYTFLPDGAGTIFRFEELIDQTYEVSGQMYGSDYAYHEVEGYNVQTFRYPVFGVVTDFESPLDAAHETLNDNPRTGYLAIITEGDSMATLTTAHGGPLHPYNNVYAKFTPRPSDTYVLGENTGSTATWTVTSSRRYTESYTIKYIMLTDNENIAEENRYATSYVGMAEAYRDYLSNQGTLEKVKNADKQMPLFIESFGSMEGTDRVLSFPVTVDIPLTTFDDVKTMTEELAKEDIKNVNFKLTGFANGGLQATIPYKLKWQEALGGDDGLEALLKYAKENNLTLYPEFEFSYVQASESFDGLNLKKHAVKTIDGRYTRKQVYDSGYQDFQPMGGAALSASVFGYFWDEFGTNFNKYNIGAISMATIGSDLNSDFDEDDPHHREDSKAYTVDLLKDVGESNEIMVSGGNAYTIPYADVITDVPLTSSEYIKASQTIPFSGIVLHGSKDFTGTPINMEGDMSESILNAIENGASIFFTLSYQNTQELKTHKFWSQYYSIQYDIWKDDVIKYYNVINEALADLQDKYIVDHEFIESYNPKSTNNDLLGKIQATRRPDEDENADDDVVRAEMNKLNGEYEAKATTRYAYAMARAERMYPLVNGVRADQAAYNRYLSDALADISTTLATNPEKISNVKLTADEQAALEAGTLARYNMVDGVIIPADDGEYVWVSTMYDSMLTDIALQYTIQKGSVVRVVYEGGVEFILNYNSFGVGVNYDGDEANTFEYEIEPMSFVKIEK